MNVLLAVDAAPGRSPCAARHAADLARTLATDSADRITVLYVREFSVIRIGQMIADHGGGAGQQVVDEIAARLRASGAHAASLVREADIGHVAREIAGAARDADAPVIVLGPSRSGGGPRLPLGSVTAGVLRLAAVPVLIAPGTARGHPPRLRGVPGSVGATLMPPDSLGG